MKNLRKYGAAPYRVAVIHGGPGVAGQMSAVAQELSPDRGVLEPLQTELSLSGQVEELKSVLEKNGEIPVVLIGFSWGAWLCFITAARFPELVEKLILISSGPFRELYARNILEIRLKRLNPEDRAEVHGLMEKLLDPSAVEKDRILARVGCLFSKADAFDPIKSEPESLDVRFEIYRSVWPEAAEMRRSEKLLGLGSRIQCPVVAIHGDHDPHPARGVDEPLKESVADFRFILLRNCGHMPWNERQAREKFFKILKKELI